MRKKQHIVTGTTDKGNTDELSINQSPKLIYCEHRTRTADLVNNTPVFQSGIIDFSQHKREPGEEPNIFPLTEAKPSAVRDKDYNPVVLIENTDNHTNNAPIISYDTDTEDI